MIWNDAPLIRRIPCHASHYGWRSLRIGLFAHTEIAVVSESGDGEREASMTRQMPYEPLPASVLFSLLFATWLIAVLWLRAAVTLVKLP